MSNLKKILLSPLGSFGILLAIGGGTFIPYSGQGVMVPLWMLLCGVLFLALAYPLSRLKNTLLWQFLVMSLCPLAMIGYFLVHEYFYEEEYICLIPAGYTGKVIIKYGQEDGEEDVSERGKVLLKIEEDGTLETQHVQKGIIDILHSEYYYVTPDLTRIPIPEGISDSTKLQIADLQFYANDSASFQTFQVGIPIESTISE